MAGRELKRRSRLSILELYMLGEYMDGWSGGVVWCCDDGGDMEGLFKSSTIGVESGVR